MPRSETEQSLQRKELVHDLVEGAVAKATAPEQARADDEVAAPPPPRAPTPPPPVPSRPLAFPPAETSARDEAPSPPPRRAPRARRAEKPLLSLSVRSLA